MIVAPQSARPCTAQNALSRMARIKIGKNKNGSSHKSNRAADSTQRRGTTPVSSRRKQDEQTEDISR